MSRKKLGRNLVSSRGQSTLNFAGTFKWDIFAAFKWDKRGVGRYPFLPQKVAVVSPCLIPSLHIP